MFKKQSMKTGMLHTKLELNPVAVQCTDKGATWDTRVRNNILICQSSQDQEEHLTVP